MADSSEHRYDTVTRRWTLVAMVLTSSVVFLDGSIVQVALPAIDRSLSVGLSGLQWVVNGNLLMVSALLIVGGFLGDRYGRRRIMTLGLLAFGVASVGSGLAQSLPWLIGTRMAQGAAGALLIPGALAVVTEVFTEDEERGEAIGTWAAWAGAVGVIEGPVAGWTTPRIGVALALGSAASLAFVVWEGRAEHPLLPLGLFRSRNFSGANLTTLALYFAIGATLFLLMIYLQNVAGFSALGAGLMILPVPLVMLLLSGRFGRWAGRVGARWFMAAGPLVSAAGLWLLSRIGPDVAVWHLLGAMTVLALGMAIAVAPLTATVMNSVAPANFARASAVNNTASRLAQLLAVTVVGAVVAGVFASTLAEHTSDLDLSPAAEARLARIADDPTGRGIQGGELSAEVQRAVASAYTEAFSGAMRLAAAMAALGGMIAAMMIRDEKKAGVSPTAPKVRSSPSEHWPCLAHTGAEEPSTAMKTRKFTL